MSNRLRCIFYTNRCASGCSHNGLILWNENKENPVQLNEFLTWSEMEKVNANVCIVKSYIYFVSKNNNAIHLWHTIVYFVVFDNCLSFLFVRCFQTGFKFETQNRMLVSKAFDYAVVFLFAQNSSRAKEVRRLPSIQLYSLVVLLITIIMVVKCK